MNPLILLLLASVANNNRQSSLFSTESFKLDNVLGQLQNTVSTLEKVSQLGNIGRAANSFSLPAPSAQAPAPVEPAPAPAPAPAPEPQASQGMAGLPNIDLQSAMQTLGPLLSMMGNGQK